MERLDALAAVYHLACLLSNVAFPIRFRWYRSVRMDAAVTLPNGKTVGIVRQGRTADRSCFAKRLWRLRDEPMPGAVLVLVADDVRRRHARRLLSTTEVPALFALEREAVLAEAGDRIWSPPRVGASVDLRYVLDRTDPGGELPVEAEPQRVSAPDDIPDKGAGWDMADHLLPVFLKPAENAPSTWCPTGPGSPSRTWPGCWASRSRGPPSWSTRWRASASWPGPARRVDALPSPTGG